MAFFLPLFSQEPSDEQLRDPEYLIEQYNQLVAKHNALIQKTRGLITDKQTSLPPNSSIEEGLKQSLNEALAKVATLENQMSKIREEGLRTNTSNQYLDDTNARLRRQLQVSKSVKVCLLVAL